MLYFTFVHRGPHRDRLAAEYSEVEVERFQHLHVQNNFRLRNEGKSFFSGPLKDSPDPRGTLLLEGESESEIASYFAGDPFIELGWLEARLHPCVGDISNFYPPFEQFELCSHALAIFEHIDDAKSAGAFEQPLELAQSGEVAFWGTMPVGAEFAAAAWFFQPPSERLESLVGQLQEVQGNAVSVRWFHQLAPKGLIRRP